MALAFKHEPDLKEKVLLFAANKGGTGKTTSSVNMAAAAAQDGLKVLGIDFDPQRNFESWALRRRKTLFPEVIVASFALKDYVKAIEWAEMERFDLLVIDTPPGIAQNQEYVAALVQIADFVVVPTKTGIFDLETTVPWSRAIQASKDKKVAFLLNDVDNRSTETRDAQSALMKAGRLCPVAIRHLTNIERNMKSGATILDVTGGKDGNARQDLGDVFNFLKAEIGL